MMSQEALSLAADVDVSYVGRVERGDNNVAILTLLKLTTALELTLAELAASAEL
jgi:transcriptional regulator with XRE-family HTH domain